MSKQSRSVEVNEAQDEEKWRGRPSEREGTEAVRGDNRPSGHLKLPRQYRSLSVVYTFQYVSLILHI